MKGQIDILIEHFQDRSFSKLKKGCEDLGEVGADAKIEKAEKFDRGFSVLVMSLLRESAADKTMHVLDKAWEAYFKTQAERFPKIDWVGRAASCILKSSWAVDPDLAQCFWAKIREEDPGAWEGRRLQTDADKCMRKMIIPHIWDDFKSYGFLLDRCLKQLPENKKADFLINVLREGREGEMVGTAFYDPHKRDKTADSALAMWEGMMEMPQMTPSCYTYLFLFLCEGFDHPGIRDDHRKKFECLLRECWVRSQKTLDEVIDLVDLSRNDRENLGYGAQMGAIEVLTYFYNSGEPARLHRAGAFLHHLFLGVGDEGYSSRHNALFQYVLEQASNSINTDSHQYIPLVAAKIEQSVLRQEINGAGREIHSRSVM